MMRRLLVALALLAPAPALADTLVDNINGISVERDGTVRRFAAMVIGDDGKIARLIERRGDAPRTDYREDGRGRTVIPGLIDSHAHVMGLGISLLSLDLSDTRTLAEAQAKIAAYAAENPDRPWIIGRGWKPGASAVSRPPRSSTPLSRIGLSGSNGSMAMPGGAIPRRWPPQRSRRKPPIRRAGGSSGRTAAEFRRESSSTPRWSWSRATFPHRAPRTWTSPSFARRSCC